MHINGVVSKNSTERSACAALSHCSPNITQAIGLLCYACDVVTCIVCIVVTGIVFFVMAGRVCAVVTGMACTAMAHLVTQTSKNQSSCLSLLSTKSH